MRGQSRQRESHTWSKVPRVQTRRSQFDRSHGYKTTFDEGLLIPFYVDEVVPGDTHKLDANLFCRFATLKKPIMDNVFLETFFFFVPFRTVWDNWERMWGAQDNPTDSTDFLVPIVQAPPGVSASSLTLWDYLGVPVGVPDLFMSALYPRGINKIWNEWFRDQNLQDSVPVNKGDGPDDPADYTLLPRGKRHDYFTSCLPFPQKGPEVLLPVAGALVEPLAPGDVGYVDGVPHFSLPSAPNARLETQAGSAFGNAIFGTGGANPGAGGAVWTDPQLKISSSPSGASINDFREAVVVQQFFEMLARGGSRYVELLQNVYGVSNGDARLQRSEYLGGGRSTIMVNPVVNTAGQTGGATQAELAAYGVGTGGRSSGHGFTKSFTEHGMVVGFLCVRADLNYQQGMLRQYSRRDKFDFLIPHFANLGEQAVLNREIFAQGQLAINPATQQPFDEEVFGYVQRYDDYRFKPSMVTGLFRSQVTSPEVSVDMWHLAQDFAALPVLGPEFIQEQPPIDRVVSVPAEPHFLLDAWIRLSSVRELPTYGTPGLRRI